MSLTISKFRTGFSLVIEASGRRYECEAKHRSGAMINVQFVVPTGLGLGRAA